MNRTALLLAGLFAVSSVPAQLVNAPCFEPNLGINLNLGDDNVSPPQPLGFSFPFGGSSHIDISVSSNGFIWLVPNSAHGCCNGVANVLLQDQPRIAAAWMDLDPSASGGVWFNALPGRAVVTWDNVPEWNVNFNPFTVQLQLLADGSITLWYSPSVMNSGHTMLIGCSQGGGAVNPGGIDFSNLPHNSVSTSNPGTVYEQFAAGSFDLGGRSVEFFATAPGYLVAARPWCLQGSWASIGRGCPLTRPVYLRAQTGSRPVLGATFLLDTGSLPTGSNYGFLVLGLNNLGGVDLGPLGMPTCLQYPSLDVSVFFLAPTDPTAIALPIPGNQALQGVTVFAQTALSGPGINPLGFVTSNGGRILLGL